MKINRFQKMKNGIYRLDLGGKSLDLHEDLILRYDLLIKKEISEDELPSLIHENLECAAYEMALKEINKKLRTSKEIETFLSKKEVSQDTIQDVLSRLKSQGYLNETVYADSYIHDRILLSSDGPLKIERELLGKGIDKVLVTSCLSSFSEEMQRERILKIVTKFLQQNRSSCFKFFQKMKYHLNSLGYSMNIIDEVLENIDVDDSDVYEKEYQKLYHQLSKKYSGAELEWKLKQKLYQRGFRV